MEKRVLKVDDHMTMTVAMEVAGSEFHLGMDPESVTGASSSGEPCGSNEDNAIRSSGQSGQ